MMWDWEESPLGQRLQGAFAVVLAAQDRLLRAVFSRGFVAGGRTVPRWRRCWGVR